MAEFFAGGDQPSEQVLSFINNAAKRLGAHDFSLLEAPISINLPTTQSLISAFLEPILDNLSEVIRDLDCDLVLVSGRPSRLPVVRDRLLSRLAVMPDRLISMSGYRVGQWYPFRNILGQISDPKTTTAVGAALTWLARGSLGGIRFEWSNLCHRSTARFIGVLEENNRQLLDARVCMRNVDLDAPLPAKGAAPRASAEEPQSFAMPQRLIIGYRQLAIERWPAMPLYELTFAQGFSTPCRVKLAKDDRSRPGTADGDETAKEMLVVEDVQPLRADGGGRMPRAQDIVIRLQTLPSRTGYWLDTGVIKD